MFSYYGSKNKIVKHYPSPLYNTIIEPFAGAAWYSVYYKNKNVILNEKNKLLYEIWDYLINYADPEFIIENSNFYAGQDIRELGLPQEYVNLLHYCVGYGNNYPRNVVQKSMCERPDNPTWASRVNRILLKIADNLSSIRHWQIKFGDYKDLPNIEATWFIDPPYQKGGKHYVTNDVNYEELKEWVISRRGQIIVCENQNGTWMDFRPLTEMYGLKGRSVEHIWTNLN